MSVNIINEDLSLKMSNDLNETKVLLPAALSGAQVNLFTGKVIDMDAEHIGVFDLLGDYPVALICAQASL
jgi:hypothetical protein